jgi:hypothetical protein
VRIAAISKGDMKFRTGLSAMPEALTTFSFNGASRDSTSGTVSFPRCQLIFSGARTTRWRWVSREPVALHRDRHSCSL